MRTLYALLTAAVLSTTAALAAPVPQFSSPRALLDAVYAQMDDWDPDTSFDETDTFSNALQAQHEAADRAVNPDGDMMGVLDFSPFINGQDSGGLRYEIGEPKRKGTRATAVVDIFLGDEPLSTLDFDLVEEDGSWAVDDISSRADETGEGWVLSEIFADAL